jgi:hypothetical protein
MSMSGERIWHCFTTLATRHNTLEYLGLGFGILRFSVDYNSPFGIYF